MIDKKILSQTYPRVVQLGLELVLSWRRFCQLPRMVGLRKWQYSSIIEFVKIQVSSTNICIISCIWRSYTKIVILVKKTIIFTWKSKDCLSKLWFHTLEVLKTNILILSLILGEVGHLVHVGISNLDCKLSYLDPYSCLGCTSTKVKCHCSIP